MLASGLGLPALVVAAPRPYEGPLAATADGLEAPAAAIRSSAPGDDSARLTPVPSIAPALAVAAVDVGLRVYRGGERLPGGDKVPRRGGVVEVEATYSLTRAAAAGERLRLLNFAEAMGAAPTDIDTIALSTYLDGPFERGRLEVLSERGAASIERVGDRRDLEVVVDPGATTLTLQLRVTVPHRFWPFGCARRRCSLSGAIAPLPAASVASAPYMAEETGDVIAPARWRVVDARFAAAPTWTIGQEPTAAERAALGGDEIVVIDQPPSERGLASYPAVFWGPRWRRAEVTYHGVTIEVLHTLWRPGDQVPNERKAQLYRDVPGHVHEVMKDVLDVAAASGITAPPGSRLTVVQGPLRSQVAEAHPTAVLLSDQFLQLFPGERFLEFHAEVVGRSGFDLLTHGFYAGRHHPATDLWLQGALAIALLDLWRVHRAHRDDFASDILGRLSFVPAVDNFLYTGQAEFTAAYFRGSEDLFPVRNHPWIFSNALGTGRRIHEKLRDILTPAQMAGFYRAVTRSPDVDPIAAAERAYGRTLGWFFDQWLGPYPEVDYRISKVVSVREGERWRHKITVARDAAAPIIEPVQVLARDRGGDRHYLIWNGEVEPGQPEVADGEHTFEIVTAERLKTVTVDPRTRLLETPQAPHRNVDPLFNNRRPAAARIVYTGFGLNVAASEIAAATTSAARAGAISGFAFFEASKRRDLRRTGHLQLYRDRETAAGIGGGINFWLGPKINRKRRANRLRLFTNVEYLTARGLDPGGGVRLAELVAFIHDTRAFSLWPDRGRRLYAAASSSQVMRVDGSTDDRYAVTLEAGWVELWPLAHRHVLASRLDATMMIPIASDPEFRSLTRGGGIGELGAYGGNEIFGRTVLIAQLEYRHTFYDNLDINALHLAWIRGIGGTLFGGAASASHCDDFGGLGARGSYYGQVGYGLTAFLRLLGVTPQFFRLDLAVPLVRRRTVCLGKVLPDYLAEQQGLDDPQALLPPVSVNVTFLQPF